MTVAQSHAAENVALARKVALSSLTGVFTFLGSAALDGPLEVSLSEQLILTAIVGSATLLTQFLLDFERRLRALETGTREQLRELADQQRENVSAARAIIDSGFGRINEATRLFTALEQSALQTDALTRLVHRSSAINGTSPPLIRELAHLELERVSTFLRALSEGHEVIYDGEDREWLLGLAASAQTSIAATSLATVDAGQNSFEGGLWTTGLGERYLGLQHQAVKRGVNVRRIFVFDRPEFADDTEFAWIRRVQRDSGVQVRILNSNAVPEHLRTVIVDFVLFDDVISYETILATRIASTKPGIDTTHLILDDHRVRRRAAIFQALWDAAVEVE
jgi:hypothetical protein